MRPDVAERAATWSQHQHARGVLRRVLEVCSAAGIRALPVKGVLTAHRLYRDPSERPIQDIDLRVTPRDFARLHEAGTRAGFRVLEMSRTTRNLVFDVEGMMVEFEAHIGPRGLCHLPVETVIDRAVQSEAPFGFPHLEPELHDHALVLVINAYKDKITEAAGGAIFDLERIAALHDFEPARLAALARATGVAALTWVVADWLSDVREQAAWARVRKHLGHAPRPLYRRIVGDITRRDALPAADTAAAHRLVPYRLVHRILTRAASDQWSRCVASLGWTLAWTMEKRLEK